MLLKVDATQLEWRVKVWMAQDKVAMKEIIEQFDIHTDNKNKFGLPTRTIAKNFLYQMIFSDAFGEQGIRGPAYSYAHKADFQEASTSIKYWENVIEKFFEKYQGIYNHSVELIRTATSTGKIIDPSGRFYTFSPLRTWSGQIDCPRTKILNYPIQGFSAVLVLIARLLLRQRLPNLGFSNRALLINTVHDDVEMDVDNDFELIVSVGQLLEKCFSDINQEFEKKFGVHIGVPMAGEVKVGWTLYEKDMQTLKEFIDTKGSLLYNINQGEIKQ